MASMLLDGEWVGASDGATRTVVNPGTGARLDDVPVATEADVQRAIQAAQRARSGMRGLPAHERARILIEVAGRMEAERPALAELLAKENGKPIRQTREELSAAARIFRGFGEEAKRVFGRVMPMDAIPGMERHFAVTIRQPLGVVAAIVPFNYPVELWAHKSAAALAAGNALISKPPTPCPLTLLALARFLEEAGLPRGAHQMLTGRGETIGPLLASSPSVQLITVTGSVETGVALARAAAGTLKRVLAELGGNDATIVCADADLERAAQGIVLGRLARGNGQICCAVKRVLVHESVKEDLAHRLTEWARRLSVGDQLLETTDVGPLISTAAAEQVVERVQMAVDQGAVLLTGGQRRGAFVDPTVLLDVPAAAVVFRDETFGPVVPLVGFSTIDQAVALANDSPFGLQAAVFTRDIHTALSVSHRLEAGGVMVNWGSALRAETLPFGGVKLSGTGREAVHDTLLEMTEQKAILFHDALDGLP
ncbi:MAG TPA: aldehyde dehydrogenase family protein [Anaeromyxobacter sp.]|nr:aldehyde dehydrogenase family protein [Anaeromyxobacter sp.]